MKGKREKMKGKKESLVPRDFEIQPLSRPGNSPLGLCHHRVLKNGRRGQKKRPEFSGRQWQGCAIGSQVVLGSLQRMGSRGAKVVEILNFWKSSTRDSWEQQLVCSFKGREVVVTSI